MNCLFVVTETLSDSHSEQQYLLMLAMLNFDFDVNVVFKDDALFHWQNNASKTKHLTALQMYGVETFYLLNSSVTITTLFSTTDISHNNFMELKNWADVIL